MQSLADIAREEAERRKLLEQQGIEGKVIEGNAANSAPDADSDVPTTPSTGRRKAPAAASAKDRTPLRSYRTALQKLDREIRRDEERLELRRARLQAGRWELPKAGRVLGRSRKTDTRDQLQREIEDLEVKLRQLRRERAEIYEEGRKAGFLPGELDGKGIIP